MLLEANGARMKRRGKSSPAVWRHTGLVNPTRSNVVEGNRGPRALGDGLSLRATSGHR